MDKKELEIMSPAGNFECLYAAVQGGADSVYFGVGNLNMRSHSANNFTPDDLPRIVEICREYGVKTYMTLNIVLYGDDLAPMREALDAAKAAGVNAIIAGRSGWRSTSRPSSTCRTSRRCGSILSLPT